MKEGKIDALPRGPILALAGVFLTNSLSSTVLLPFAAFMVGNFRVTEDKDKLGYYAGYLASAFNVGTLCSCFFWGTFSDRVGRRPVLLFGLASNFLCALLFGFAVSFPMAISARVFNGLLSGVIGVGKTALAEITSDSNQAAGFSVIGVCWGIGLLFGPALGGFLCQPVEKYPALFKEGSLFDKFPFALPCIILAILTSVGWLAAFFLLPETLQRATPSRESELLTIPPALEHSESTHLLKETPPETPPPEVAFQKQLSVVVIEETDSGQTYSLAKTPVRLRKQSGAEVAAELSKHVEDTGSVAGSPFLRRLFPWLNKQRKYMRVHSHIEPEDPPPSSPPGVLRKVLGERDTLICITLYCVLSFTFGAFDEVFPLWSLNDWSSGGLSFGTNNVGMAQTAGGASLIPFQLLAYPMIVKKVGPLNTLRIGLCSGPFLAVFPLLHYVGRSHFTLQIAAGGAMTVRSIGSLCSFTSIFILVSNSVSDPSYLGTTNGIAQTAAAVSRAIAPTVGGSLFAWSMGRHGAFPLDYHLPFMLIGGCMLVNGLLTFLLPKTINERKFSSDSCQA